MHKNNFKSEKEPALKNSDKTDQEINENREQEENYGMNTYESFDENENDSYGNSYKKYNGYNGWSDDVIDDAFDGDPEATWNVD